MDIAGLITKVFTLEASIDIDHLSSIVKNSGIKEASKKIVEVGTIISSFCTGVNNEMDNNNKWIPYHHHGNEYIITTPKRFFII